MFPQGASSTENPDRFMPGSWPAGMVLLSDPVPSMSYLLEQESEILLLPKPVYLELKSVRI